MLATALVVCLVVTGSVVWREHERASAQERVAVAHRLALHAAELRDDDPVRARDLGLAAVKIHADEQTRAGLIDTLVMGSRTDVYSLAPSGVDWVALSGDGRIALTGDTDGVGVWDLRTWLDPEVAFTDKADRLAVLKGNKKGVSTLVLSFDGRTALIGGEDGSTIVWNLTDPAHPARLATLPGEPEDDFANSVQDLALTRDARIAMTADFSGNIMVWDLASPSRPVRLSITKAHGSYVQDVTLSADGRTAVTAGEDRSAIVWDLADPARPVKRADLALPADYAEATAMSADGRTIVVANSQRADVWRLDDRTHPTHTATLDLPPTDMYDVALTPDGKTALMAGSSGTGFLWDLSDPARPVRLANLKGYTQEIISVALSADGRVALMTSPDRGLSLWNLADLREIVADPVETLCRSMPGRQTISRADWIRFAGGADWSDYGEDPVTGNLSICFIR
ncbi:WD40 repeat domain-containing protein [Nonomuraea guangzhouensis]|uniref:WD40 repeat domain-containing protein n=1 Tax=Nonomuraea guangzhouensis TaxID=1291555 RepID=A0ABW4GYY8_9ACTN|nr:WD40 repeat domain-containing protein [Nonomuraea guangzhouensis]